ncbi:unnamed protein product [Fusarium venenatum]|uniref:Uncharacterized protein n=1 Tax=Fusarium venenatum TaxID=56646 RepID=A0A2L2T213_9HYPO|nr:uncharacterized protein FVRRES_12804 [Fusarium venenatum]CEI40113.1 unnamed protein product [Fusarium venenatum]
MRRSGASPPPSGGFVEQPDSHQYPAREKNHSVPIAVDAWLTTRTQPPAYDTQLEAVSPAAPCRRPWPALGVAGVGFWEPEMGWDGWGQQEQNKERKEADLETARTTHWLEQHIMMRNAYCWCETDGRLYRFVDKPN